MALTLTFVSWDYRPAIKWGGRAWAVLAPGEDWTEVDGAEVSDSGRCVSAATFAALFPDTPELPGVLLAAMDSHSIR